MKPKLLLWLDTFSAQFGMSKWLQEDCDIYAIIDVNEGREFYEKQNIVPNYVPFYSEYQLNMIENNPHGQWIYITNPWLLHNKLINSYQQAQPLFYY